MHLKDKIIPVVTVNIFICMVIIITHCELNDMEKNTPNGQIQPNIVYLYLCACGH